MPSLEDGVASDEEKETSPPPDSLEKKNVQEKDSEKEEKKPADPLASFGEVLSFAQTPKVKLSLGIGMFCASITGFTFPALAWVFADSFERLSGSNVNPDFMGQMKDLAFQLMALGAIVAVFMTLSSGLLETAAGEMTESMKRQWFEALLRQDMAYYDITDISGTATIINTNGKKYKKGLGRKLGEGIQFVITILGSLAFAFYCSWRVSLVVMAIVPAMAASSTFLLKMTQSQTSRANSSYAKAGSLVYTAVSSIRTILALNAVEELIQNFTDATQEAYVGASSQVIMMGLASGSVMASFTLVYLPVSLYGAYILFDNVRETGCDPSGAMVNNEACSPAAFGVFGALMGMTFAGSVLPQVSGAVESLTGARSACYPALLAIRRNTANANEEEKEKDERSPETAVRRGDTDALPKYAIDSSSEEGLKPESAGGDIVFDDVIFAYPTRQEIKVFNGFSLNIKAGQTVALCGPSGGGKSTVVQLIERFYDPLSGSITLDGHNLKDLNVNWLRQHIGLVSQEPKLFACSIKDNIKINCPDATQEEVEAAAKKANAHDFIMSFPDGYDTDVGNEGTQLSGGQKQRVSIARVLISKPSIILLDEATSALDSESEVIVQEALDLLMKETKQTIIAIAHRLSTIRHADMIAVVSGGKIIETGKHEELLEKKGSYYGLIEAQKGGAKENAPSSGDNSNASSRRSSMASNAGEDHNERGTLLSFHDVHFNYPSRPDQKIFHGLDLDVKEGETLALVGPSGQGKSTIIQLVENFYHPSSGVIKYKGVDMQSLNIKWFRTQVGLVSQEPTLFDTTIAANIKMGMPEATQDEIEAAAKEANAHDFIMSFPDGYETDVGAGSTQISGGQKQRIAIARALIRKPKILLLDEATSALDSESEKIVQDEIDKIMLDKTKTTIVIAHRLSTIRNADRIAVIDHGRVRELGTHDELMALPDGKYKRLQTLQDLGKKNKSKRESFKEGDTKVGAESSESKAESTEKPEDEKLSKEKLKEGSKKARTLSKGDESYFVIGSIGALLAGLMFPGWGIAFAYMMKLLYHQVLYCNLESDTPVPPPPPFSTCEEFWNSEADSMEELSYKVSYGLLGLVFTSLIGHTLVHYGFGTAVERMNKRVRDAAFKSLVRQEVAYFDVRPVSTLTTHLSDDAAMIHSFSGEPLRQVILNLSSIFVGLVVSFVYMWPFALSTLGVLPFMAFGSMMEMKMYLGEDEGDIEDANIDFKSAAGIVIESLLNIRTVASLTLEKNRLEEFIKAMKRENPTPLKTNIIKATSSGLGQICQLWSFGLLFWWGGWLIKNHPNLYTFLDMNISMFALLYGLSGMSIAFQGATDRDKANLAAYRIFNLIERESLIDPLSEEGRKDV